jgi:phosphoribosylamine---glycine ligase
VKVLVIGSGAREHALVWKLSQSPKVDQIYTAPGNAGTALLSTNLNIKALDFDGLARAVKEHKIDLIVVGPEDPLAAGIVDYFQKIDVPIFGPTQAAAQLEASKAFAKSLFQKYDISCANSQTFSDFKAATDYIRKQGAPLVIKADGLAAGKGVIMAETETEALTALSNMMEGKAFGSAGDKVIIEEKLSGREMSYFVITDGKTVLPLVPACDYKRVNDNDEGLNTGGMGSYSPPFFYSVDLGNKILSNIIEPTTQAMVKENRPYVGFLYAGLFIKNDIPKILEYNVRLGDPETQVVLPRLKSDLLYIILGTLSGKLAPVKSEWDKSACVGVVLASGGYPSSYRTGYPITGLDDVDPDIVIFHAGTKLGDKPGQVLTNGGRVLTVVALGKTVNEAREKIYSNIPRIKFEGMHYRKDIAQF